MKEKDLEKTLDNLIIDGLIKEAEQENADFEAAMRAMSEEEFEALIDRPRYADSHPGLASKWKRLRPWLLSGVAAAAVILAVLIPSINEMNGKLCDSALYASEAYMTPWKGGFDAARASNEEVKAFLPELEKRYSNFFGKGEGFAYHKEDLKDAGWDLAIAYLKLHRKGDAIRVLKVLAEQFEGTPFGDHCRRMIDQL